MVLVLCVCPGETADAIKGAEELPCVLPWGSTQVNKTIKEAGCLQSSSGLLAEQRNTQTVCPL